MPWHTGRTARSKLQVPAGIRAVIPVQESQSREQYMNSLLACVYAIAIIGILRSVIRDTIKT